MKKPTKKKQGKFHRPLIDWPYSRHPGDFQGHLEDLYFWGAIDVQPFRQIFTDPVSGMLNIEHKNLITRIRKANRGGGSFLIHTPKRPYYRSRGRTPQQIELIRYKSAKNRQINLL